MKTVAEFAKKNNVTPQTVYRKIDKAVKQGLNGSLTEKIDSVTYITENGEKTLSSFLTGVKHSSTDVKRAESEEVLFLREQNKSLQEELKIEREHSRAIANRLATITENQQKLLGMEQVKTAPAMLISKENAAVKEKKHGFFSFFKRNAGQQKKIKHSPQR